MRKPSFPRLFSVCYVPLLLLFTVYVLLDTFVIPQRYQAETPLETAAPVQAAVKTENSYTDGNISITLTQHRAFDTDIYVAEVTLSSPQPLKTALAQQTYGKNITDVTSSIVKQAGAILAVNGDYYSARNGYVLKNGTLYRESAARNQEDLCIDANGDFFIISEQEISARSLLNQGVENLLSFGPALVKDGQISVDENEEVSSRSMLSNPRTALAQTGPMHYLFVVSDGRTNKSRGLSLYELAEFLQSLGAQTAYNLDGGGSATMVFDGRVINNPTTNGRTIRERSVSDIVCIIP